MNIEIKKSLSVLELSDLARIIEMQEKDIKLVDLSYEKRLELLLETLIQERENRLINRLIRNAYFKYPSASLESLDYDSRQIKKSTILNLATMGFVSNATNLVITGPTGAGKTYLACALGVEACRQTYRVLYIRMPDLMRNFENQNNNLRELTKYRKRIGNYQILILDEWLNYKISEKDAKNLYELFEQRSGNHSTVFVGQYPVDEWHGRLGGGTQADSIMDRIIHNAYEIPTNVFKTLSAILFSTLISMFLQSDRTTISINACAFVLIQASRQLLNKLYTRFPISTLSIQSGFPSIT